MASPGLRAAVRLRARIGAEAILQIKRTALRVGSRKESRPRSCAQDIRSRSIAGGMIEGPGGYAPAQQGSMRWATRPAGPGNRAARRGPRGTATAGTLRRRAPALVSRQGGGLGVSPRSSLSPGRGAGCPDPKRSLDSALEMSKEVDA